MIFQIFSSIMMRLTKYHDVDCCSTVGGYDEFEPGHPMYQLNQRAEWLAKNVANVRGPDGRLHEIGVEGRDLCKRFLAKRWAYFRMTAAMQEVDPLNAPSAGPNPYVRYAQFCNMIQLAADHYDRDYPGILKPLPDEEPFHRFF